VAAILAGCVNAIAGGGTLISFPMLTAVGVPAVAANVTNTVALCPGMVGGIFAQRGDLASLRQHLWWAIPVGVLGGIAGGVLLLSTDEASFRALVPYLILAATGLLAAQDVLRRWIITPGHHHSHHRVWLKIGLPVGAAAVYGGYFGAGLGVILLAVLGLTMEESLNRLNVLKQIIALAVNLAAACFFAFSGQVVWPAAVVMAVGALVGGSIGGHLANRIRPSTLRQVVVALGVIVAVAYLLKP
jgi:uncharacterized membrane protein YfcA